MNPEIFVSPTNCVVFLDFFLEMNRKIIEKK